jgi:hypothetical protein
MGRQRYPNARELTVTADCGGSNGARVRLWKLELQKLADETGLVIRVHHYPPGTSKSVSTGGDPSKELIVFIVPRHIFQQGNTAKRSTSLRKLSLRAPGLSPAIGNSS